MDRSRVVKAVRSANASVRMEGYKPSRLALKLARMQIEGKITREAATELILRKHMKP